MNVQNVPSDFAQRNITNFLIFENVKPAKILERLHEQFGHEILSQVLHYSPALVDVMSCKI